jgi:hypothetical protein
MNALRWWVAAASLLAGLSAQAGTWGTTRTLQGPFGAASPPDAPHVTMNANGHALLAWNASGPVMYADRPAGAAWQPSAVVPGGSTGAGPVAVALGRNEAAAIAWVTVATRYVPAQLLVALRLPGGTFGSAVQVASGTSVWDMRLGIDCTGTVTLVWNDSLGIQAAQRDGGGATPGACDGLPGNAAWSAPQRLSASQVGAALPDLALNDAGAALAVWQEGPGGAPTAVLAALRPAGEVWQAPATISTSGARSTWNPKPALDAAGNAAVGYLDDLRMAVARRPAGGGWTAPDIVSGSQNVYYPALAVNERGDLLAAWQALDANNVGSVWQRTARAGAAWSATQRLSAASESAQWPSAAWAGDGSVAVVGWVDDNTNSAKASLLATTGRWVRSTLGAGWWGGTVPVAAGRGGAVAGWAVPTPGNPNSARLVARSWQ